MAQSYLSGLILPENERGLDRVRGLPKVVLNPELGTRKWYHSMVFPKCILPMILAAFSMITRSSLSLGIVAVRITQ